jgi:hypothetical protein
MGFWSWKPTDAAVPDAVVAVAPRAEPIQVFTADALIEGTVEPTARRMTDLLNTQRFLSLRTEAGRWESINTDEVLLVAPPPHTSTQQMRVHRRQHRVLAIVGPYEVTGIARAIPGINLDPYLLRTRQHFLPITHAVVRDSRDPSFEQELPVVIVNVGNTTELSAFTTLS